MEIEELNRLLFAMTERELAYQAGERFDWSRARMGSTAVVDGREVLCMGSSTFDAVSDFQVVDGTRSVAPPLAGRFTIKRNSRFNPVPEHVHDYIEMSYVYAGSCPQTVSGSPVTLKENQVLLLDSNCPHAVGGLGQHDIMLSMVVSKPYLRQLLGESLAQESMLAQFLLSALNEQTDHRRYVRFHSQDNRRIRRFFQELMCEYLDPSPNAEAIILHLLRLILAELMNVYEADCSRREEERPGAGRVSVIPIIRYIEENFLSCTQESVAERFYISPNYVSTLLKKHTGMTYRQMVQAQRLGCAASLLRNTELPVSEVARRSGYENQSFFYRKIREQYGCLPAAYRSELQLNANRKDF